MHLDIQIEAIQVVKEKDKPFADWGDSRMELYQTWQMFEMAGLEGEVKQGRQGACTKTADDTAKRIAKGDWVEWHDPRIRYEVPADGRINLDMHFWESDSTESTKAVKRVFDNDTLQFLKQAWDDARKNEDAAKKGLSQWLDENAESLINAGVTAIAPAAGPIVATYNIVPLLKKAVSLARNNKDDYHSVATFVIQIRNGKEWRVMPETGESQWMGGGETFNYTQTITCGPKIEYHARFRMQAFA